MWEAVSPGALSVPDLASGGDFLTRLELFFRKDFVIGLRVFGVLLTVFWLRGLWELRLGADANRCKSAEYLQAACVCLRMPTTGVDGLVLFLFSWAGV